MSRLLGLGSLIGLALTAVLGLFITPPDKVMGNLVRLLYVHPAVAWVAYLAFGVCALGCILYLWPRTRSLFWDHLAAASAEIGVVFCTLTLATGSIWGRPTWGVWWAWDARLTTTAILLALFIGYLALRRVSTDPAVRAKRSAVAGLVAFADVPIVHMSVVWWNTLHQPATVLRPGLASPTVTGSMAWTMLLSFASFSLLYCWLLVHRYRSAVLESRWEEEGMELALAERWAEAGPSPTASGAGALSPAGSASRFGTESAASPIITASGASR